MIFGIQRGAGWDFPDIHTGKAFHTLELDVRAIAAVLFQGPRGRVAMSSIP